MIYVIDISRHVMLPKEIAKLVPKSHLMSEAEWRGIGVQQSQGWIHYMMHKPGMRKNSVLQIFLCDPVEGKIYLRPKTVISSD